MPNPIIDIEDVLKNTSYMKHVNYFNYRENNLEVLNAFNWDFEWIRRPRAIWYPGDDIFKARLMEISFTPELSISGDLSYEIRGYSYKQKAGRETTGTVEFSFIDKEDQAIAIYIKNAMDIVTEPDSQFGFRKEDYSGDIRLIRLNSSRIPVREYIIYNLVPADGEVPEQWGSDHSPLSECSLSWEFEHFQMNFLNIRYT